MSCIYDRNFSYGKDAYEALFRRQSDHYSARHLSHRNDHHHCSNLHRYLCPSSEALLRTTEPISFFDSLQSLHLACSIFRDCLNFLILDAEVNGSHLWHDFHADAMNFHNSTGIWFDQKVSDFLGPIQSVHGCDDVETRRHISFREGGGDPCGNECHFGSGGLSPKLSPPEPP